MKTTTLCLVCHGDVEVPITPEKGMKYLVSVSCPFCQTKITVEVETIVTLHSVKEITNDSH